MSTLLSPVDAASTTSSTRPWWRRPLTGLGLLLAFVGLFFVYLAISRTQTMNADGASIALQAWDLLHGNVLLGGWITDIPFYTNELLVLAGALLVKGLDGDVVHICAAIEYTLLTFAVGWLAKSRARGLTAIVRVGVALSVMLVPQHGLGVSVLLLSPDHTGSTVYLVATLLVLDRALTRETIPRWLPYAVAAVLVLGQLSDPLIFYVGAVPLILVCALRLVRAGQWRPWRWRGLHARLIVVAIASVVATRVVLLVFGRISGVSLQVVQVHIASPIGMAKNVWIAAQSLAANFGAYFHDRDPGLDTAVGVVRLALLVVTLAVVAATAVGLFRRRSTSDSTLVDELLVYGVLVNLGAFVFSTIPVDVGSARQIAPVTFLAAALAGRVLGPRVSRAARDWRPAGGWRRTPGLRRRLWQPVLAAAVTLAVVGELVVGVSSPAVPHENYLVARFLVERNLTYGLGGYWSANNITLQTGGRIQVRPVWGSDKVYAFRWLSKPDWYDASRHDARFVVIRTANPQFATEAGTLASFGPPAERVQVSDTEIVYIYDHNLLVGLPAWCNPGAAASITECA